MSTSTPATPNGKYTDPVDTSSIAEQAKDKVADAVSQGQEALGTAVTRGQEALDTAMAKSSDEIKRFADTSNQFVRENPGIAIAGAAGLGLLIGLAMRTR